jgi:hypothetical protein
MLYHLLPGALWSSYDPRQKPEPHADGIVGSANVKSADSVMNHLKELSLSQSVGGPTSSVSSKTYLVGGCTFCAIVDQPKW